MKFIAFFAFVATVNAVLTNTTIVLCTNSDCSAVGTNPMYKCGGSPIFDFNVQSVKFLSASISFAGQQATFFSEVGAQGDAVAVLSSTCLDFEQLQFIPKSFSTSCYEYIFGSDLWVGPVSYHISVLFTLFTFANPPSSYYLVL